MSIRPRRFALPAALLAAALAVGTAVLYGAAPAGSWSMQGDAIEWFGTAGDLDGDGIEELIMPSVDGANVHDLSPPTRIYILKVENQTLVDRSVEFFGVPPLSWSVRRTLTGDFDGDGQLDVFFCGAGREMTDRSYPGPRQDSQHHTRNRADGRTLRPVHGRPEQDAHREARCLPGPRDVQRQRFRDRHQRHRRQL